MAQTAIDFYFIGLLVERGGIGEGLRDATLLLSLFLVETLCVCVRACVRVRVRVCVFRWVGPICLCLSD